MAMSPNLTGPAARRATISGTVSRPRGLSAFAAGSLGPPDLVVTGSDWPKLWTRPKGGCKGIVVTESLITTCGRRGTAQKAASQAGLVLRRRNIFRAFSSQRHFGLGTVWG